MRFSVVVPTFQRRRIVVRSLAALEQQVFRDFEVVVVVDGSTDGTASALRELPVPFSLRVLEFPNRGRAQALNSGVAESEGELILFLDDDMRADPALLLEHDRSQRAGVDLVLGDIPLDPESPPNLLSRGVRSWAESRRERLVAPDAEIRLDDLLTGQCSVARRLFEQLGGFDVDFTRDGLFGGEDIDFGYRLRKAGHRVGFNPRAISYQYYDVDPADYLRRSYETGRSEQELIAKHPEQVEHPWRRPRLRTRRSLLLLGPLVAAPPAISWPLRAGVSTLARTSRDPQWFRKLFFGVRTMEHLRGARAVRESASTGRAVVLAYHAIADLRHDRVLAQYGVPPRRFVAQLDALARRWRFVDLRTVLDAIDGNARLPARTALVTFDDLYADFEIAARLLAERRVPAVAFAVAGRIGGTNDWDRHLGAGELHLLGAEGLHEISRAGIEIGSHGATHRPLPVVPPDELTAELSGSASAIEAIGLPRPRALAYPHGEWTPALAQAVADAGYEAAFTVDPGVVGRGVWRYALPRIEVLASDTPFKLRVKMATAGWRPGLRTRVYRLLRIQVS